MSGVLLTVLSGADDSSMFYSHAANVPNNAIKGYPLCCCGKEHRLQTLENFINTYCPLLRDTSAFWL